MTAQTDHSRKHRGGCRCAFVALVACVAAFFASASSALGQCQYSVQEIVAPPCPFSGPPPLIGRGLNIHGEVVGFFFDCEIGGLDHAFYWSAKTGFIELPKPDGATTMRANDINNHGQIVGEVLFPGVAWKGFMYDMNTEAFHFLESKFGVGTVSANAINNAGVAAGSRSIEKTGTTPFNAVIWDTNTGEVTDLGVMQGPNSAAQDIDETGQMAVGWDGTITPTSTIAMTWANLESVKLGPIPGRDTSWAIGINAHDEVVGTGMQLVNFTSQAFVWTEKGFVVVPPPSQFNSSTAIAINDLSQVLIRCAIGSISRPFLWQHGEMLDLNTLIESGPQLTHTSDINNQGNILVRAATKAVLLTPIDVPVADLNYDCKVDVHDLMILLDQWGPIDRGAAAGQTQTGTPSADLNGDGVVDVNDLFILLANWG